MNITPPAAAPITSMPHFTIRWTEPLGALRTREHSLEVDVRGEEAGPLRGSITGTSSDLLGTLPAGGTISNSRIITKPGDVSAVETLWKQILDDKVTRWLPASDGVKGLDRSDLEIVIERGAGKTERYRADLDGATQPVKDIVAAAARILTEIRLKG